jgi:integrase
MHDRSPTGQRARAAHRAGVEVARPGRRTTSALVTLHGLRHTAGSLMLLGGVPLTVDSPPARSRHLGDHRPHLRAPPSRGAAVAPPAAVQRDDGDEIAL